MTRSFAPVTSKAAIGCALIAVAICVLPASPGATPCRGETPGGPAPMVLVVMDPLALPLSCECVKGHAQRKYEFLAAYLEKETGRRVEVVFSEALGKALQQTGGRADLVIGKQSVVEFDAAACRRELRPVARLTGKDGATTQTGLFVVPTADPARSIADLKGYRIIFGPEESAEKHSAAMAALKKAGVPSPEQPETVNGCSDGAFAVLENRPPPRAATVISSYAMAVLEGCGTIDKGALRVVGQTEPVPFITVFAAETLDGPLSGKIVDALLAMRRHPALLTALESKDGFVPVAGRGEPEPRHAPGAEGEASGSDWPQWRGPRRDAIAGWLPETLPPAPTFVWKKPLTGAGLSGLAVSDGCVIVADRDPTDRQDVFRCLDAETGRQRWTLQYPAPGDMDYGNSSRATPLVHDGRVYLLGALGDLHCVSLSGGEILWKKNLISDFGAKLVTWDMTASPLIVDGRLIVNPGARTASVVALDPQTGATVWSAPGLPAAYSSFIVGEFGGVRQIVGYDSISLGGWDIATGRRLWRLLPPEEGDFNVPTPVEVAGKLLVATENNGTRLYGFDQEGKLMATPVAENGDLAPDASTPVVLGRRVFGVWGQLFCLDLDDGLKPVWVAEDEAFEDYASIIGRGDRLLITTAAGELLLVRADGDDYALISRLKLFDDDTEVLSHPALVGHRLYVRDARGVSSVALGPG